VPLWPASAEQQGECGRRSRPSAWRLHGETFNRTVPAAGCGAWRSSSLPGTSPSGSLRHRPAGHYERYLSWRSSAWSRDQAQHLRALRVLQPLVALRLDPRHWGAARGVVASLRHLPGLHVLRSHVAAVPRTSGSSTAAHARVRRRLECRRTIIERPQSGRSSRAAK
jgi:hypothetical protein